MVELETGGHLRWESAVAGRRPRDVRVVGGRSGHHLDSLDAAGSVLHNGGDLPGS